MRRTDQAITYAAGAALALLAANCAHHRYDRDINAEVQAHHQHVQITGDAIAESKKIYAEIQATIATLRTQSAVAPFSADHRHALVTIELQHRGHISDADRKSLQELEDLTLDAYKLTQHCSQTAPGARLPCADTLETRYAPEFKPSAVYSRLNPR